MKPIDGRAELKQYYEDPGVAAEYMDRRTTQPLNSVLHRRQVHFLNRVVGQRSPMSVLEIACGPGRLTAAIRGVRRGVAVDASPAMLATALRRMNGAGSGWSFLRTDAFVLPFRAEAFDAVYSLRFVRHFQLEDRRRLYAEVQRVLRPRGIFVVDALNRAVSYPYRVKRGLERYQIYDVLYQHGEIEAELQAAGFRVVESAGILKHVGLQRQLNRLRRLRMDRLATVLVRALEHLPGREPSTWMLVGEKE